MLSNDPTSTLMLPELPLPMVLTDCSEMAPLSPLDALLLFSIVSMPLPAWSLSPSPLCMKIPPDEDTEALPFDDIRRSRCLCQLILVTIDPSLVFPAPAADETPMLPLLLAVEVPLLRLNAPVPVMLSKQ